MSFEKERELSRRDFLKVAFLGGLSLAAGGYLSLLLEDWDNNHSSKIAKLKTLTTLAERGDKQLLNTWIKANAAIIWGRTQCLFLSADLLEHFLSGEGREYDVSVGYAKAARVKNRGGYQDDPVASLFTDMISMVIAQGRSYTGVPFWDIAAHKSGSRLDFVTTMSLEPTENLNPDLYYGLREHSGVFTGRAVSLGRQTVANGSRKVRVGVVQAELTSPVEVHDVYRWAGNDCFGVNHGRVGVSICQAELQQLEEAGFGHSFNVKGLVTVTAPLTIPIVLS